MKKWRVIRRLLVFILGACVWGVTAWAVIAWVEISSQLSPVNFNVAAQDPLPTPTTDPSQPTPTPTTDPSQPTPTGTPSGRFIQFGVTDDDIDLGDCVELSWNVVGDFLGITLDEGDDGAGVPVQVDTVFDSCPTKDTEYALRVTWSDLTVTKEELTVKVDTTVTSSSSSGATTGGTATAVTPIAASGPFRAVTPILITTTFVNPIASASGGAIATPSGILGEVSMLPETGLRAPSPANTNSGSITRPSEGHRVVSRNPATGLTETQAPASAQSHWPLRLALTGGLLVLLGSAGLNLTLRTKCISLWARITGR